MNRDKNKKVITVELPYSVWLELHNMADSKGMKFGKFMQLFIMDKLDESKKEDK